jgi:glycosyltransferase involved in cell wall biosynthesis
VTIRVLHVINSLAPGGAERQLVDLVTHHDPARVESTVVTLWDRQGLAGELKGAGIPVETLRLRSPRQMVRAVHRLRRYIRVASPDVVHTRLLPADLVGRVAAVLSGRPPVVSSIEAPVYDAATFTDDRSRRRWKLEALRAMDRLTGRLASVTYVACSSTVAQSTARALAIAEAEIQVIHNSTTVSESSLDRWMSPSVEPSGEVRLLTVGRLAAQKGQLYLVRTLPRLVERYPRLHLDVVGTGPLHAELRRETVRLGVEDRVRFLGTRDDVRSLLRRAHLFVLPSLWEGLSIVALEALATGVPLVATNIPSMQEIVLDGVHAVLVPPRDADALAHGILRVLADPNLRDGLSRAAREHARIRFDVRTATERYERLYRDMVSASVLRAGRRAS